MKNVFIKNTVPVQKNFKGNGAIYHGYAGFPDECGRVYSQELCDEEARRVANMRLSIARTFYGWWAWDEKTGEIELKSVVEIYENETSELIHVFVEGEEIVSTPEHPFYSPVKGWTEAVRLRAGDILVLINGEYVVVEKVQHEILETPITVYNFHVSEFHTYFVSSAGTLVHNSCATDQMRTPDQQALADLSKEIERNAKRGQFISYQEAIILDEWALEYGVPQHHSARIGSGTHWSTGWDHTHIYNMHVPFFTRQS